MSRHSLSVLIIEDDEEDFEIARDLLASASTDFTVDWAQRYGDGLEAALGGGHDVCLVDYDLRGASGIDLVREAQDRGVNAPMILLTGHGGHRLAEDAQLAGADDFISKASLNAELLERTVRYAVERRRVHAHLRESESKYRTLFHANPVPTWVSASDTGEIIAVNDAAVNQYGYTREEFLGLRLCNIELAGGAERPGQQGRPTQARHRRRDGTIVQVDVSFGEVAFDGRKAYMTLARDVTESRLATDALRESEQRFQELVQNIGIAFFIFDAEARRTLYLSPAFESVFRIPAEQGLADPALWREQLHPDDRARVESALAGSSGGEMEFRLVRPGETPRWIRLRRAPLVDADGRVHRLVGTAEDITALRSAQQQAEATSRMEAVGRLAGGVAHDFNNILTAILGEADMLRGELEADDPRIRSVTEIINSGMRAAGLTQQLLAFGRQQMFRLAVLDLNEMIDGLRGMLTRLIGEDVELCIASESDLGPILADASQVEQVIVNLAVNARDAMPNGGRLRIATTNMSVGRRRDGTSAMVRPGRYTVLTVSDNGTGMTDDVKARIFEPFFTTKELGQGTGLGLATVYGIVKQSNGYIIVDSTLGVGTSFSVYFPQVAAPVDQQASTERPPEILGGTETVLVVEDEDAVRAVVSRVLSRRGYNVIGARNGTEAVTVAAEHEGSIDLVLSDIVMPAMTGPEAVAAIRRHRREVKVLFMSGYTDRPVVQHQRDSLGGRFLQKPFTPDTLLLQVRSTLDGE